MAIIVWILLGKLATHLRALRQCLCITSQLLVKNEEFLKRRPSSSERAASTATLWSELADLQENLNGVHCGAAMAWTKMLMSVSSPWLCLHIRESAFSWILKKREAQIRTAEWIQCFGGSFFVLSFRPLTVFSYSVTVLIIVVNKLPLRLYFKIVGFRPSGNCCSV